MAEDVRAYIAAEIRKLLATGEFVDGLPGYLVSNKRARHTSQYCSNSGKDSVNLIGHQAHCRHTDERE